MAPWASWRRSELALECRKVRPCGDCCDQRQTTGPGMVAQARSSWQETPRFLLAAAGGPSSPPPEGLSRAQCATETLQP